MIKRLDEAFGCLLDALKSLGILENTVVLYTSDHGNHFKTRNAEYKRSCHDASLRVPTALSGPGFSGQGRLQNLVNHPSHTAVREQLQMRLLARMLRRASLLPHPEVFAGFTQRHVESAEVLQ